MKPTVELKGAKALAQSRKRVFTVIFCVMLFFISVTLIIPNIIVGMRCKAHVEFLEDPPNAPYARNCAIVYNGHQYIMLDSRSPYVLHGMRAQQPLTGVRSARWLFPLYDCYYNFKLYAFENDKEQLFLDSDFCGVFIPMTGYFRSDVVFPELAAENISKIEFWKSSCEIEIADKAEIAKYIEKYKNGEIKAPDQAEKYGIYAVFEEYPVLTYFMGFYPADAVSPTVSQ